jgi:para-aminobenzoate synthetase / 4-amino-4-deoxychorismate lyase
VASMSAFRLMRRALDWELSPEDALSLLRSDAHPVALLGAWAGGADIIASEPLRVRCPPQSVADVLDASQPLASSASDSAAYDGCAFGGGWIGYLGFGASREFLPVPPAPGGPRCLPDWWFGYYDHVLRRDGASRQWVFEALWTPGRGDALEHRFEELSRRPHSAILGAQGYSCGSFRLIPAADDHMAAVRRAVDYIRQGDIFQANICLRLEADFTGDPLDAFCLAAGRLHPPHAAFLRLPAGALASMSPELFLRRTGTAVITRPIKGTRWRPADAVAARRQRELLLDSAKDRAENVMIVDLMRNDLSRVCTPGSVRVPRLLATEAHPGVWHLVSDVIGRLPAGTSDEDLLAAAFPPGSVTGAPKVRALEIIHELEAIPREAYTGAIGYRSPLAGLELNVAIRTFEFREGKAWLGSGGGITARSDADSEYRECLVKAAPLIAALDATVDEDATVHASAAAPAGRTRPAPSMLPRPAAGVFTSLRVTGGYAAGLAEHLARLENSTIQLYGKPLPPGLPDKLAASLADRPCGRLRITARPVGGPLQVTVEVVPAGTRPATVTLLPVTINGGLGAHKWRDRRLLNDLASTAGARPDEHLLIEDRNRDVLETDRASVFAVIGGVLHTPPADGRLLPGVTRAAVLALAAGEGITSKTAPVTRERLCQASEVFVTNSVHGVMPVRAVAGGTTSWVTGPVATRMAAVLGSRPSAPASTAPEPRGGEALLRGLPGGHARPGVILIDNYDSFTYNLAHTLQMSGCQVEVIRNDEATAQDIAAAGPAGIVISPGPCTPADAGVSIDTIRLCGPTTPLLGICLGHQAIAAAYGARIVPAPRPIHGQAARITHDSHGVLAGLPRPLQAARYHSLIVDEHTLPASLTITARTAGRLPMGVRHALQPTEGLQFHPESILTTNGILIITNFVEIMRKHLIGSQRFR